MPSSYDLLARLDRLQWVLCLLRLLLWGMAAIKGHLVLLGEPSHVLQDPSSSRQGRPAWHSMPSSGGHGQ